MVEFPGNHIGRCDITELEEPDDWENMPLGRALSHTAQSSEEDDEEGEDQR
jgi:hypothetical protein